MFEGKPLVLLHNVGARSGIEHVRRWSPWAKTGGPSSSPPKAGADQHRGWFHNLKAEPNLSIEIGDDKREVVAVEITGQERDKLYSLQEEREPQFAGYALKTGRKIPVIELAPKSS